MGHRRLHRAIFVLALVTGWTTGCDDGPPPPTDAGAPDAGPPPPGYDAGTGPRVPEAEASAGRASCAFARGAMPWETIGEEYPIGPDIPIDHIIVLTQENRSFDHYFGTMPGVEGIPADASNPDASGTPVAPFHTTEYCVEDVHHSWNASHTQYGNGANDGFIVSNDPNGERALGYLDGTDLPFYWDLAQTFAMSDHHHCSVLGPTWVNRFYLAAGTSFGYTSNGSAVTRDRLPAEGDALIYEQLDRAGVSWGIYAEQAPWTYVGAPYYALRGPNRAHVKNTEGLIEDLASGDVPSVVFVDPLWADIGGSATASTDEHPPANPQIGQAWVANIIRHIIDSPIWPRTAIILTYDEHGGFYDHVPPPEACPPGDFPSGQPNGEFDRLGFRVPLIVVSPYSRPGYVSDRVTDLSSVPRLIQVRFLLPALTGRDANAWPFLDMFDFDDPALTTVPELDEAVVDEAHVAACEAAFP
ncbi:MAG: phospholipase C [Sandaracinaceae bacterium]